MSDHKPIFRRIMKGDEREHVIKKYSGLLVKKGSSGLLEGTRRDKLMRASDESGRSSADNSEFWNKNRELVENGLSDLQLISSMAHNDELKKMFSPIESTLDSEFEPKDVIKPHKTDIPLLIRNILTAEGETSTLTNVSSTGEKGTKDYRETVWQTGTLTHEYSINELMWRFELVERIISECVGFMLNHELISSKAHRSLIDNFIDMINSELRIHGNLPTHSTGYRTETTIPDM